MYKEKYLKYKEKYNNIKQSQVAGGQCGNNLKDMVKKIEECNKIIEKEPNNYSNDILNKNNEILNDFNKNLNFYYNKIIPISNMLIIVDDVNKQHILNYILYNINYFITFITYDVPNAYEKIDHIKDEEFKDKIYALRNKYGYVYSLILFTFVNTHNNKNLDQIITFLDETIQTKKINEQFGNLSNSVYLGFSHILSTIKESYKQASKNTNKFNPTYINQFFFAALIEIIQKIITAYNNFSLGDIPLSKVIPFFINK